MKKRIRAVLFVFVVVCLYQIYHNFFSINMLIGSYSNMNYEYGPVVADVPYGPDVIRLNEDNTFSSTYWGTGVYEIDYSITGTKLNLTYDSVLGKASRGAKIKRQFFSRPRIMLVPDMNHYMEKTNS